MPCGIDERSSVPGFTQLKLRDRPLFLLTIWTSIILLVRIGKPFLALARGSEVSGL